MNDSFDTPPADTHRPALPVPTLSRWQPLRLGLVELFHYDSEEFWFRDGHLLLRGNNGTGKSKVLSLTLPFLFDAQLKASRIEPDGDAGKKMAWNLLMGSYDRRVGYAWIEFGRLAEDGTAHYLTLGAGLSAVAARQQQVDGWFFILEGGGDGGGDGGNSPRINQDIWLTNAHRTVLSKERLREALLGCGQVFDTAASYRRAVDERLFRLGPRRYDALMDTLIQLRQPQLSKKPDEAALSNALTEALPPLAPELLGDVAEALGQLEEDRRQLEDYQALARAVDRFEQRYRIYAGTQSRRQARALRQAQTDFDNASRLRTEAQLRLENAQGDEARNQDAHSATELALAGAKSRFEALRDDPTMQDANRLEGAAREAAARQRALDAAATAREEAVRRTQRAATETKRVAQRVAQAERTLAELRRESAAQAEAAGIVGFHAENPLAVLDGTALADLPQRAFDDARATLRTRVASRREQIALLQKRQADVARAEALHAQRRETQDQRQDEAETATERRTQADSEVERQARSLVETWERYLAGVTQLHVGGDAQFAALSALADWVVALGGDNPARLALQGAQQHASERLAARRAALDSQRQVLETERRALESERDALENGVDAMPPLPYTRAAESRTNCPGAPLWQLLDFREAVTAPQRAGLEAALEASGLLDAWVSPDGRLQDKNGDELWHDTQMLERPPAAASLADWLHADVPEGSSVPLAIVERLLAGIACADHDSADADTWIAPDGRFRLGALAGAWTKPTAAYIGHAARATARARRLAEIAGRLAQLADERLALRNLDSQLVQDQEQAAAEWRSAPADEILRNAHSVASACAGAAQLARGRLAQADAQCREAEQALTLSRQRLTEDAADMRLPETAEALQAIETALGHYRDVSAQLAQGAHELRLAMPERQQQETRELEARADQQQRDEQFAAARIEAEEARARLEILQETVGAKVDELQRQLAAARLAVKAGEEAMKLAVNALILAGQARAVASEQARTADDALHERGEARAQAAARLQQFAASGLLSAALPHTELPALSDKTGLWTIDAALTLARRAEQSLMEIKDDDDAWTRVQRQINEELTELQRSLGTLGHQAPAETSDWGLVVHIVYQNRPERPDRLASRLADEISQRSELLTATEREVLENHLQAEIAAEVQRLLQAAERQVAAINQELHKRPTSTGVRFRLVWQGLSEEEGAPVGLEAARKRLLNTSADLWSLEDRQVVGAMFQQRIAAERERADAFSGSANSKDSGGSLLDQLARALDYRHWHRFRVERWNNGSWSKLSGPASSGERALGLTVPLFAAVASFYSQSSYALAPRLMLLDEAFAGIDDAARAHCMGLIREFDLDFVITSEREWGCYAELPGVAICQLQRREGIDAVFVSRWTWDGRGKARDADPDRRFPPA